MNDAYRYVAMAQQPFGSSNPAAHNAPFAWRLLTPLLVYLLPLPTLTGFWIVTLLGLAAATLALVWLLRGFGLPEETAIAGGLAFVFLMPATGFTLFDDKLVDPLAFALLTLALAACVHRRGWLQLLSLTLCALDKETALFGAIFAIAWSWQQRDRLLLRWSLASLFVVLAALTLMRVFIPASDYNLSSTLFYVTVDSVVNPIRLVLAFDGAWGILLPLAFASRWFRHCPAAWLLWLAATAQVCISYDIERVVVYAFPVMIAASCWTIETLAKSWHISRWWLWMPVFALELSWTYTYGPHYFFTLAPMRLAFLSLFAAAALSIVCVRAIHRIYPRYAVIQR